MPETGGVGRRPNSILHHLAATACARRGSLTHLVDNQNSKLHPISDGFKLILYERLPSLFEVCRRVLRFGKRIQDSQLPNVPENLPRIGSALLVRDEANRILLGKRNKDPQRGSWVIPGGKIHAFESIAEAAARELHEETGLAVEVGDRFNVYEIINPPNEHRIVIYSWAKVVGGEARASDDLSELKFFELKELGEVPVTPLVRQVLIDAGYVLDRSKLQKPEPEQFQVDSHPCSRGQ